MYEAVMPVMSDVSPANGKRSSEDDEKEGGVTVVLMSSTPSGSDHTDVNAPPPESSQTEPAAPPPPPLLPALTSDLRRRRVRSFYWKPIPEERVQQRGEPNLWTLGRAAGRRTTFHIDIQALEELFGHRDEQRSPSIVGSKKSRTRKASHESKQEITILNSKRSMNVGIFLKRLKKSNHSIISEILNGNSKSFGPEPLRELLRLLPDAQEVEKLRAYRGDPTQLSTVDSFMYQLTLLPKFDVRIEAMFLQEDFPSLCTSLKKDLSIVHSAARELLNCLELHSVLHLVLEAGNIMNAGGYGGNAVGFRLSSLLSLADTKANKPGMNLLHFVALEAKKQDEKLLMFPEKLQNVERATRVNVEELEDEWENLNRRIRRLEENLNDDTQLLQQVQPFLQSAAVELKLISNSMAEVQKEGKELINFFCEDVETFKLDECLHVFQHFCSKFKKAVQENVEREVRAESQLKHREDKRRSWSGGEKVGGVFGSRSSSETDVSAVLKKEGLFGLLTSQNLRRSRQRLSNSSLESPGDNHSDTTSPPYTHSTAQHNPEPQSNTHPDHTLMTAQVETHTLVPALQAFHFTPDTHHSSQPPQNTCLTESGTAVPPLKNNNKASPQLQSDLKSGENTQEDSSSSDKTIAMTFDSAQQGLRTAAELEEAFQVMNINQKENQHTLHDSNKSIKQSDDLTIMSTLHGDNTSSALSGQLDINLITDTNQASESKSSHESGGDIISNPKGEESCSDVAGHVRSSTKSLRRTPSKHSASPKSSSSSSQPSLFSQDSSRYRVRTLTPSESQSMRKVISLGHPPHHTRPPSTLSIKGNTQTSRTPVKALFHPGSHTQASKSPSPVTSTVPRTSSHTQAPRAPVPATFHCSGQTEAPKAPRAATSLRRSVQKPAIRQKSAPEEKMCRSTLRALAQAGGRSTLPSQESSGHGHAPRFAQNTVASSTRSTVTTDTHPVRQSTRAASLKGPSLNRTASLRAAQSRATPPASSSRTGSVHLPPPTGHDRKNINSLPEKSAAFKDSPNKAARPAWR